MILITLTFFDSRPMMIVYIYVYMQENKHFICNNMDWQRTCGVVYRKGWYVLIYSIIFTCLEKIFLFKKMI